MSQKLGYSRYGAHGGDWGAMISAKMGSAHPENLAGIHINFVFLPLPFGDLPKEDSRIVEKLRKFSNLESAYAQLQATKPDSLAIAQSDSPAGIAAWIIEKFRTWSDCRGIVENSLPKDKLLTNIMFYWVTNSIASSARLYYESHADETFNFGFPKVEVPTGVALFPGDPFNRPRSWADKHYNITRWTQMPHGGHFPAMEAPELLIKDIQAFFRTVR
jgi:microsomal epoxide hydrolase